MMGANMAIQTDGSTSDLLSIVLRPMMKLMMRMVVMGMME